MIWRMRPTTANRNQIDAPFRPTVLQQRFPNHHPSIDLAYWAELRDQLILCEKEELEIGMVVYRWHMSSVVEFPQYQVAVSALELFAHLINPSSLLASAEDHSSTADTILIPLGDCSERDLPKDFQDRITVYCLDRFQDRKLPALMAQEYPFLDFTNGKLNLHSIPGIGPCLTIFL